LSERQQDVLRLQPQMIPAVRARFASALEQLQSAVFELNQQGYLPSPWLGDEASIEVAAHYTSRAMDGPESSFQALMMYRDELTRIHDTLEQMERYYRRDEAQKAADLRRMT
jgi:hypothetical protein